MTQPNFESWSTEALRRKAKGLGMPGASKMPRDELLALLKEVYR